MKAEIDIRNIKDVEAGKYIVCSVDDEVLWFWGAYDTEDKAIEVAIATNRIYVGKSL